MATMPMKATNREPKALEQPADGFTGVRYQQLAAALAAQIEQGQLRPGDSLPSVRALARKEQVNPVTVITAYRHLAELGLVYSRQGSGTYVLPRQLPAREDVDLDLPGDPDALLPVDPSIIRLSGNSPMPDFFPVESFKLAMNTVLDTDGGLAFGYEESQGYPALRERLVHFARQQYRIKAGMDQIMITTGAQQAIDLLGKVLLRPGDTVLVENPSYIGARSIFSLQGARMLGVPMQADGLNLDVLENFARRYRPRLLYTMPVYQTPTGISLSPQKARQLIDLAARYDFYILEDDLFSDLDLRGEHHLPLKSIDTEDRVVYIKSFSKLLMPGLRTAFLIAPERLHGAIRQAKYASDIANSGFFQRVLTNYLGSGAWQDHLLHQQQRYRQRLTQIRPWLKRWQQMNIKGREPQGGLGLWLTLPAGLRDEPIWQACLQNKVLIEQGHPYYCTPAVDDRQHVRIGFAATDQLAIGLERIDRILRQAVNRSSSDQMFL
jgi:DNA-binding transcriptional MocR family regulator